MSISDFLIKKKIAKNEAQANIVMIGIIIVCFVFIIISNIDFSSNRTTEDFGDNPDEFIDPVLDEEFETNTSTSTRGEYSDFDLNINL